VLPRLDSVYTVEHLQSLHEAEQFVRGVYDAAPGGIVRVAKDGSIKSANLDALRILGVGSDDRSRRSLSDWHTPLYNLDGTPCVESVVAKSLATGQPQGPRTIGIQHSHGDVLWAVWRVVPVFDPDGAVAGAVVSLLDVTERKRAEDELRRSEQKWRLLAENVPDFVMVVEPDGRFISVNHVFPELDEESVLKVTIFDFLPPDIVDDYRRRITDVFSKRAPTRFENRGYGAKGTTAWYDTILVPLIEAGTPDRLLIVARDITDRRRAEEAFLVSEHNWRVLVSSLPDDVIVVDRERTILSSNRTNGDHPHGSVIGTKADAFLDRAMVEEWLGHFRTALETGMPVRLETRGWSAPGRLSWYESILVPLKENGVVERVMIVARDISQRRAMLASLAEKERLASLGMVASSVAHEIMNPLAYVLANLDHARGLCSAEDDESGNAIANALEGAKRMQQIVWDLRALGRVGNDELFYVDARSVLEAALRLSGQEVGRAARIVLDLEEVPGVFASESRLCQVFINLLVNAAQAMSDRPPAEREITVRTRHDEAAGIVAIDFTDTGVGIDRDALTHIFEPFYTTKRTGIGLGLSISRDIIERIGGRITVESTPGKGTTFTVSLSTTPSAPAA